MDGLHYGPMDFGESSRRGAFARNDRMGHRLAAEYTAFLEWVMAQPRAFFVFRKDDLKALRCFR